MLSATYWRARTDLGEDDSVLQWCELTSKDGIWDMDGYGYLSVIY